LAFVALVLAVGIALAAAGPAAAANTGSVRARDWPNPWASRILTPRPESVAPAGVVHVSTRLGPGVKRFRAWVGGSSVTGAFDSRDGGALRTATLRVGQTPGLRYGSRVLYVETFGAKRGQHWWAERHIVVARPGRNLFSRLATKRIPGAGARVVAMTRSPRAVVTLQVNGGAWRPFAHRGRRHSLRLNGDLGLRPGINRVAVRAVDPGRGRYETARSGITLPSSVPVAGAGAARRVRTGRQVRFSAAGTNGVQGKSVRYRWRIVKRPAGSKARLHRSDTMNPVLRPDRIGHYVLRLTVSSATASGVHAAAARASAVGSQEGSESAGMVTDSATTTLDATPNYGAIGTPVDTITPQGITIGESHYEAPAASEALQLLVLERTTLAKISNTSYPNSDSGTAELLAAVEKLSSADLAILVKPQATVNNATDSTANKNIDKALEKIGVRAPSQAVTNGSTPCEGTEACSVFSAIGVPGVPVGQGSLNDGLGGLAAPTAGDLHGYFQENLDNEGFTFVSAERVPFDTGEPTGGEATVTVGSNEAGSPYPVHKYTSQPISSGGSGFYVLVLSAGNLALVGQNTYADNASGLAEMQTRLSGVLGNAADLIIVRSIGAVERVNTSAWNQVGEDLQKLGASQFYFDQLNGGSSSQWAQVSPGGDPAASTYPDPDMQFADHEHTGTGRLTGLLARDDLGQLYPSESSGALEQEGSPLAGSLGGIMSMPQEAWPEAGWTKGELQVEECIAETLTGKGLGGLRTPIRANYTNEALAPNWASWKVEIEGSGYFQRLTEVKGCESLNAEEFKIVREQLETEWSAVGSIWKHIEEMQSVLGGAEKGEVVRSVALGVVKSVGGNSARQAGYDTDSVASDALWGLSTVPPFNVASDPINFVAASLALASDLQQHSDGATAARGETTAVEFAAKLSEQTSGEYDYLDREGEILVGDPNKLVLAARNTLNTKLAAADWAWEEPEAADALKGLMMAVRTQSYLTLFPTAYSLYRLQGGASSLPSNPADYQCSTLYNEYWVNWSPFSSVQQNYGYAHAITSAAGTTEDWTYGAPETSALTKVNKTIGMPSEELLAGIFGPAPEGDAYQTAGVSLFDGIQFAIEAYANATENTITVSHSSGGEGKRSTTYICNYSG